METDRLILLRRPPRMLVEPGQWIPPGADLDEVDRLFALAQQKNKRLHDGAIWHVLSHTRDGHGGVTLHVMEAAYRFQAVARLLHDNEMSPVRPLGVKCMALTSDGWLMGRRSGNSLTYGGEWEFLGGGSLGVGEIPVDAVRRELREEAGLECNAGVVAVALLFDARVGTWDIVHHASVDHAAVDAPASWEHTEVVVEPNPHLRSPRSHATDLLLPLVK